MKALFTQKLQRKSRGFTLIELLVVLAILTLLAGLVGPKVLSQLGGAKSKTAGVQIADLQKALDIYKLDVGRYPTTEGGLTPCLLSPDPSTAGLAPTSKAVSLAIRGDIPTATPTPARLAVLKYSLWVPTLPPAARVKTPTFATLPERRRSLYSRIL